MRLDEVIDLQSPALFEEEDRGGRELLRDRRHLEPCARTARDVPLDVCQTVALADDHVAAAGDEHGTGEGSIADIGLHDLIHPSDVLREADSGPSEPRQQHEGEPMPVDARLHGTPLLVGIRDDPLEHHHDFERPPLGPLPLFVTVSVFPSADTSYRPAPST